MMYELGVHMLSTFVIVSTLFFSVFVQSNTFVIHSIKLKKEAKRSSPNTKMCRKREKESRMRKEGSMTQITFRKESKPT